MKKIINYFGQEKRIPLLIGVPIIFAIYGVGVIFAYILHDSLPPDYIPISECVLMFWIVFICFCIWYRQHNHS